MKNPCNKHHLDHHVVVNNFLVEAHECVLSIATELSLGCFFWPWSPTQFFFRSVVSQYLAGAYVEIPQEAFGITTTRFMVTAVDSR
jgi:hypothetical protein